MITIKMTVITKNSNRDKEVDVVVPDVVPEVAVVDVVAEDVAQKKMIHSLKTSCKYRE
jgi:hypothetical protein